MSVIASAKPREIKLRRFFKTEVGDIVLFSSRVIATDGGSECRAKTWREHNLPQSWPQSPPGNPGSLLFSLKNFSKSYHQAGVTVVEKTDRNDESGVASGTQARSGETGQVYAFGPYRLNPGERALLRGNEAVTLPPKAFDTLVLMVRNSGRLMEKDELIRTLWPGSFVEDGSLSNNIFVLRKALGEDPRYIETVPKRGYRFVGAVQCLPDRARGRQDEGESQPPRPTL